MDADCPLNQEICCDGRCCPPGGCEVEVVLAAWDFDTIHGYVRQQ